MELSLNVSIKHYKHYKEKINFFEEIELSFKGNGFHLITGNSGVGKTTLFKIILGIEDGNTDANINFSLDNKTIQVKDLIQSGEVGFQPDDFVLIPWLNVMKNLHIPFKLNDKKHSNKDELIKGFLSQLGLKESILDLMPHQLSYGMKARVNLLRAFLMNPKLVILDELYSGLDKESSGLINSFLIQFIDNCLIIAISHQEERAEELTKSIYHIDENRTIIKVK